MDKLKNLLKSKFGIIVISVIAFLIAQEIASSYRAKSSMEKGVKEVEKKIEVVVAESKNSESPSAELKKKFDEFGKEHIEKQKTEESKAYAAANIIWGAYMVNLRSRYEYCKNYGVELNKFVDVYKKRNSKTYEEVKKFQEKIEKKNNLKISENDTYAAVRESNMRVLDVSMKELSSSWKVDMKTTCEAFNLEAENLSSYLDLSKTVPEYIQILTNYTARNN